MKKNKSKILIWLATMTLSLGLVACSTNTQTSATDETTQSQTSASSESTQGSSTSKISSSDLVGSYDEDDLDESWSSEDTTITLSGSSATVEGSGASVSGNTVTITEAGTYVVSGSISDGNILIVAGDTDVVHLVLNDATITSSTTAPISATSAKKVVITLADGTTNTLTDASAYVYDTDTDEPDATLFVKNDLTINGSGTLVIDANFDTALKAKDNLLILSGNFIIDSVNKAIKGTDSVTIEDGTFVLNALDDGVTTDGALVIYDGDIDIENSGEGLEGWTIDIQGGTIDIVATDDGINARGVLENATEEEEERYGETNQSDTWLKVSGGVINVVAAADALDSNGSIYIDGGEVYVLSTNAGMEQVLDYNGEAIITGGIFIGYGNSLGQTFASSSTQNYISAYYTSAQSEGSTISVTDASGSEIVSYTALGSFSVALISSPDLVTGETITVTVGSQSDEVTIAEGANQIGTATGGRGAMGGGGRGGAPASGEGTVPSDGGTPPSDMGGEPPSDGGTPPSDMGGNPPDGGTPPSDMTPPGESTTSS